MTNALPAIPTDSPTYFEQVISIHDLFMVVAAKGTTIIEGRTFNRCVLQGPAVLLTAGGVLFDDCDMGPSGGDVRNLLLKPVGPQKVVGAIPLKDCRFIGCRFYAIGFTGNDEFLAGFQRDVRSRGGAA
ncbi:hypothetical protein [Brevundimonas sp.]|uniref:hypothetical protein n=1 Tax=Brevundimonas sp. TaxID=1871086 RepID=UPI002ABBEA08|nr:hypothetical protein [Brevundimonas sp.]MDZ4363416.1 hypothetical protein [Brevundimonas sp.]